MRQITGGDALFLYSDRQSRHQHISTIYIYDQSTVQDRPLRFKTILDNMEQRLGASPVYRQKLVEVPLNLDYPYWINDPEFDLEYHVRHIALPKPGDWRQLCILASRIHSRPLDMTRPVWEMYVIEGLDNIGFLPPGAFAIMTKIHHVAIDGVSAAELTMSLHDTEPYPTKRRRPVRWRPGQVPNTSTMLMRAGANNLMASIRTGTTLARKLTSSVTQLTSKDRPAARTYRGPHTRFNDNISPHRVWDAERFPLQAFKQIKDAVPGSTINDVVLAVCGGAMTRYLDSKGELPERDLTSLVPVSVRSETESGSAGNKVHLTITSLCTLERDPLKRLALVRDEMRQVKALNAVSAREMVEMQEDLPAPTLLLAGRAVAASRGPGRAYRSRHNMVVTNVPGPQQPLYFCGARLVMFTGLAIITDNLGISHAVTSYDGNLVIAPLSDRKMMPDPAFYAECLRAAFDELAAAVTKKSDARGDSEGDAEKPKAAPRKKAAAAKRKAASGKTARGKAASPKAAPRKAGARKRSESASAPRQAASPRDELRAVEAEPAMSKPASEVAGDTVPVGMNSDSETGVESK
jgi:diacylglycerol O-acyltransferase / wax synthase